MLPTLDPSSGVTIEGMIRRIAPAISLNVAMLLFLTVNSSGQQKGQTPTKAPPKARIILTVKKVPPLGPGSDSETYVIAGSVSTSKPERYKIVVYAHTNKWYVQPTYDDRLTDIATDGSWNTTTHPGDQYAVLVVDATYQPSANSSAVPGVGGKILAQRLVP